MGQPVFVIRPFRIEDEADVVELWSVCFPGEPSWNDPHAVIDRKCRVQPELFLVGMLGDELICTVMGGFDGFRGWVYRALHKSALSGGYLKRIEVMQQLAFDGCVVVHGQHKFPSRTK